MVKHIAKAKCRFSKKHIADVKHDAKLFGHKYGMAIIKWDGEHSFVSGKSKRELLGFAKNPLKVGDYRCVKIVKARGI